MNFSGSDPDGNLLLFPAPAKLEFLFPQLLSDEVDVVLTSGSEESNH